MYASIENVKESGRSVERRVGGACGAAALLFEIVRNEY